MKSNFLLVTRLDNGEPEFINIDYIVKVFPLKSKEGAFVEISSFCKPKILVGLEVKESFEEIIADIEYKFE